MHELSIAMSITDTVLAESRRRGGLRVRAVHVKLGQLSSVDPDALQFAWGAAAADTELAGAELRIEQPPMSGYCAACGGTRAVVSIQRLFCSQCGTPLQQISGVAGMEISALEVEE